MRHFVRGGPVPGISGPGAPPVGAAVCVADNLPRVRVRDTKDHSKGELTAAPTAWAAFTAFARACAV
ncbi:DUF397 domain-containing protein [Streptomyces sp. NPDC058659]|uniref:DUF397 domain-containing protein n=1 Tax=Streptomyces sp. NPDC058659 TaxID=3346581 RepID=UPI003649ECCE